MAYCSTHWSACAKVVTATSTKRIHSKGTTPSGGSISLTPITVQGIGASLSPALGGWIAQWIGYGPTFLLLGSFGLASMALWLAFGAAVKKY